MANLNVLLGEMTQPALVARGMRPGAKLADWKVRPAEMDRALAAAPRPLKKRGGCKACDGTGCVGRCRF